MIPTPDPAPAIVLVAAMARNRVIGVDGDLPWRLPDDLKRFKALTLGKPMIMGRKTFDSIGRALPGRRTIVVTRDRAWTAAGVETAGSLDEALGMAASGATDEIVIAGGGEIYAQALPRADRLRLTLVDLAPEGDARFPEFDPAEWRETEREPHAAAEGRPAFVFVDYARAGRC